MFRLAFVFLFASSFAASVSASPAGIRIEEDTFYFDVIGVHEPVEPVFKFRNTGTETLHLTNVVMTQPLMFREASSIVKPGEEGMVRVSLGIPRIAGAYEGELTLQFTNSGVEVPQLFVRGNLTPAIECSPMPAFFAATHRGEEKTVSIEISNNEKQPLSLTEVTSGDTNRFYTRLVEIERGQRFRLDLTMTGRGTPGHAKEMLTFQTSSSKQPVLKVQANTLLKERVSVFPEAIDFGALRLEDLEQSAVLQETISQVLMVYQHQGKNLKVEAQSELPFLDFGVESSEFGDRCEVKVRVRVEQMKAGTFDGVIRLSTNDPDFPRVEVPVKLSVLNSAG